MREMVGALCALTCAAVPAVASAETIVPKDYGLVWADEFDRPGLPDPAKWTYDTEFNRRGWFNNEKQYYSAERLENSRVEGGNLIIEARADAAAIAGRADYGRQQYSSARLMTRGLGYWRYGAVEVRAKLPCGVGTWPGIWMLPNDVHAIWPDGGEIDIMEHVGADPGKIHFSTHTKAENFKAHTENTAMASVKDVCTAMHRYQLRWTPNLIVMGVDDRRVFALKKAGPSHDRWPFDAPFYLLLNIAVGGDWGGIKGISPAAFPARMEVDYVRVYQPAKG